MSGLKRSTRLGGGDDALELAGRLAARLARVNFSNSWSVGGASPRLHLAALATLLRCYNCYRQHTIIGALLVSTGTIAGLHRARRPRVNCGRTLVSNAVGKPMLAPEAADWQSGHLVTGTHARKHKHTNQQKHKHKHTHRHTRTQTTSFQIS